MYRHYQRKTVNSEELDRLLKRAGEEEAQHGGLASVLLADEGHQADDQEIDEQLTPLLDALCLPAEDERWHSPGISAADVITAIDELGFALATIYEAHNRQEKVIVLDDECETDAQAWAMVGTLPGWVRERYRKLVLGDGLFRMA